MNLVIREALDHASELPVLGDRLVCMRNDHNLGIYNGGMFRVKSQPRRDKFTENKLSMLVGSQDFPDKADLRINVWPEFFTDEVERLSEKELRQSHHFDFGYALTVHKSQGSQWNNVIVENESGFFDGNCRQWLYTAITRASVLPSLAKTEVL